VPLRVHGHYSRAEIEAAFGVLTTEAPRIHREGVLMFVPEQRKQDGRPGAPTEPFVCLG